mmetsp:Transcript_20807/g.32102  ORF Transcript_20807/g.32102 Transcript_20807/m.32102 type:complete len:101 (+) Transcript_20807:1953-2255(+)
MTKLHATFIPRPQATPGFAALTSGPSMPSGPTEGEKVKENQDSRSTDKKVMSGRSNEVRRDTIDTVRKQFSKEEQETERFEVSLSDKYASLMTNLKFLER